MDTIFLKVLNMSTGACYVIAAVMLARLLLRRAPKIYSYLLWAVVGFRLCCPFSFQSVFSLFSMKPLQSTLSTGSGAANPVFFPDVYGTLEHTALTPQNLPVSGGSPVGYTGSLPSLEGTAAVAADTYTIMDIAAFIWIAGIILFLLYGMVSYLLIRRMVAPAVRMEDDVWQSDKVRTPFILGVIRPKIYIPFGLTGESLSYVLTHEHIHLQRKDHLVKNFAFLVLTLHWFNPLVWLSFRLLNKDMEMSCDEQVLQKLDGQNGHEKKGYSLSLLSFASDGRFYAPGPLAFGESAVKSRIKNVLRWEQPKRCMTACALVFCLVVTAACAANPPGEGGKPQETKGNVVAEVWGYRITEDWLEYRAMNLQYMGHENPQYDIEKLRSQYPGVIVSFEEIEGSVSAWAKEQGASDFEICTTVTSLTGKTKQVYLKMTQDSVPYYVWLVLEKKDNGTWHAGISERKSESQAVSDLNRTQLTLVSEGGSKRTAYSFENFCLFPDEEEYNFGMVVIDWTDGKETVTVNFRQGMQHNIIDRAVPGFYFQADMSNPKQPRITMSQMYSSTSGSGQDIASNVLDDVNPELYYGKFDIPVEQLQELAALIYEYVPLYAAAE